MRTRRPSLPRAEQRPQRARGGADGAAATCSEMCGLWPRSGVRDAPSGVVSAPCAGRRAAHGVAESLLDFASLVTRHTSFRFPDVIQLSSRYQSPERSPQSARSHFNPPRHVSLIVFTGSSPLGDRRGRRRALKRVRPRGTGDRGPAKRDAMYRAVRSKGVTLRMFWRFVSALISQQHTFSVRGPF